MSKDVHVDFHQVKTVLVTGAGGGIGRAFVEHWLGHYKQASVFATVRDQSRLSALDELTNSEGGNRLKVLCLDAANEDDYQHLSQEISGQCDHLDMAINCIGFLHSAAGGPEKRLSDMKPNHLMDSFAANALPVVFLAKHLFPLFKNSNPAMFASLSARVGSIQDNRSGGWYSYRASKAAHNMMLKNISLELERFRCQTLAVALHPGTTETKLSEPFIGRTKYQLHTSTQTAANLMRVMERLSWSQNGSFLDWQGDVIEW